MGVPALPDRRQLPRHRDPADRRRLSGQGPRLGAGPGQWLGGPGRSAGGCRRAGAVGDGCALPSTGGGHGAPRRLPAPPRPRPPQRPLLAGAGAAPAGRRLPSRAAVRPRSAPLSGLRSAPLPPAGACPAPPGGRRGREKRQYSAAPSQGARSAALPVGVFARYPRGCGQACPGRCRPNPPCKSLRDTHAPPEAAAAALPHGLGRGGRGVCVRRAGCGSRRALGRERAHGNRAERSFCSAARFDCLKLLSVVQLN